MKESASISIHSAPEEMVATSISSNELTLPLPDPLISPTNSVDWLTAIIFDPSHRHGGGNGLHSHRYSCSD
jgi:hypothetical protein